MTRVLITGAAGLLGQNLFRILHEEYELYGTWNHTPPPDQWPTGRLFQCDLTNRELLHQILEQIHPHVILNTAAYTAVDRAEVEPETAHVANAEAVKNMLELCEPYRSHLFYFSTDYVFDGQNGPYAENDPQNPQGQYAKSKAQGEEYCRLSALPTTIVRINVLYGTGRKLKSSFVSWLLKQLKAERPVTIVNDQYNNPTHAGRLSELIKLMMERNVTGTWHFGAREVISRYTFALKIADCFGLPSHLIRPISTTDLKQTAPRPLRSGLVCEKVARELDFPILPVHEELQLLKKDPLFEP